MIATVRMEWLQLLHQLMTHPCLVLFYIFDVAAIFITTLPCILLLFHLVFVLGSVDKL